MCNRPVGRSPVRMIFDDIVVVAIKQSCKVSNNVISDKRKPLAFRHQGFIRAAERLKNTCWKRRICRQFFAAGQFVITIKKVYAREGRPFLSWEQAFIIVSANSAVDFFCCWCQMLACYLSGCAITEPNFCCNKGLYTKIAAIADGLASDYDRYRYR